MSAHFVICVSRTNITPITINSTADTKNPRYPQLPKAPKNCHSSCPEMNPAPKKQPT